MTKEEAKVHLELISRLAQGAEEGLQNIVVPFFVIGFSVVLASSLTYALVYFKLSTYIWLVWFIIMPIAGISLSFFYKRRDKIKKVRHTDIIYSGLWISIGIAILLLMGFSFAMTDIISFKAVFFILGLLLFIGYTVMGSMLRKRGRLILTSLGMGWAASGIACLFVPQFMAPIIIIGATLLFECVPALAVLLHNNSKKRYEKK